MGVDWYRVSKVSVGADDVDDNDADNNDEGDVDNNEGDDWHDSEDHDDERISLHPKRKLP